MTIEVQQGFRVAAPVRIDDRFSAVSIADALASIPVNRRYQGLTVFILDEQKEYWFKNGTSNSEFVEKAEFTIVPDESLFDTISTQTSSTFDFSTAASFVITLNSNKTIDIINQQPGQVRKFVVRQNVTGGWMLTFPNIVKWTGTPLPVNPDIQSITYIELLVLNTNLILVTNFLTYT